MTPRRVRFLAAYMRNLKDIVEIGTISGIREHSFRKEDFEIIGEINYLLENLYPDGLVPPEIKKYQDFVNKAKGIDFYHNVYEDKLLRDSKILINKDKTSEADDPVYARALIGIIESDMNISESKLVVIYQGDKLYEENIPKSIFIGLPDNSTLIFEYTSQGLTFELAKTMEECESKKIDLNRLEKVILESLARDAMSKTFVDSVYEEINNHL
jgi:hypothetical protein